MVLLDERLAYLQRESSECKEQKRKTTKLEILTDPVKDREHVGVVIVVRKTQICSPEFTCTMSKNKSIAGVKKSVCDLEHGKRYLHVLDLLIKGLMNNTNIQYNAKVTIIDNNTIRTIKGIEYI